MKTFYFIVIVLIIGVILILNEIVVGLHMNKTTMEQINKNLVELNENFENGLIIEVE